MISVTIERHTFIYTYVYIVLASVRKRCLMIFDKIVFVFCCVGVIKVLNILLYISLQRNLVRLCV